MVIKALKNGWQQQWATINVFPLVVFRIIFGLLMAFALLRMEYFGWIDAHLINPEFHFSYWGFEWVQPLGYWGTHGLVAMGVLAALGIASGFQYRLSAILFFVSWTYLSLIDKTWYLNHYYFVSLVSFILMLISPHHFCSLDVYFRRVQPDHLVQSWQVNSLRLMLGMVYFFAGVAKIKGDWLWEAQPLKIWLQARTDLPVIGGAFDWFWVPYFFCWAGMFYDLLIPFGLSNRKSRPFAYVAVVVFHVMTWLLFNIGVFPWVMIASTLIFFTAEDWAAWSNICRFIPKNSQAQPLKGRQQWMVAILLPFFALQIFLPLRHFLTSGNVLWTEQGYRYAWHVMLMEKNGHCTFIVKDEETDARWEVLPRQYLLPAQEQQMAFQPDMILEFAHFLGEVYRKKGVREPVVTVEAYASLNGRRSRLLIDPQVNLMETKDLLWGNDWILPLESAALVAKR
ncbi:type I deoxyribonuclease HsdR (plasmid) [Persicobacter psychrovividus]|uniref:Type I deoxyribonuclease HsdR n=2 Tax=Persicobacter psychrovividus TaxID=387638 RepID=A0ABN6LCC2_9BACT|nr:type I deoxyribonuclease HsdR [Persicobacter psychrovividus]